MSRLKNKEIFHYFTFTEQFIIIHLKFSESVLLENQLRYSR